MTVSEEDLTDEQQEALKNEGLEVNIEPRGTDGTQNAPISKDIERS
jgi:fructose-specific phosphotransferase system component IIB